MRPSASAARSSREGVGIALDAIRANKVRAGLTILGVAVGVFVVVVISAAIHGINASVAKDLESAGPTTFFVSRFPITLRGVRRHRRDLQVAAAIRRSRSPTSTALAAAADRCARPVRTARHAARRSRTRTARCRSVGVNALHGELAADRRRRRHLSRAATSPQPRRRPATRVVDHQRRAGRRSCSASPTRSTRRSRSATCRSRCIGIYHYEASFLVAAATEPRAIVPFETARRHLKRRTRRHRHRRSIPRDGRDARRGDRRRHRRDARHARPAARRGQRLRDHHAGPAVRDLQQDLRRVLPRDDRAVGRRPDRRRRGRGRDHDDLRHRAHARDRRAQGARRHARHDPLAVPRRGGDAHRRSARSSASSSARAWRC